MWITWIIGNFPTGRNTSKLVANFSKELDRVISYFLYVFAMPILLFSYHLYNNMRESVAPVGIFSGESRSTRGGLTRCGHLGGPGVTGENFSKIFQNAGKITLCRQFFRFLKCFNENCANFSKEFENFQEFLATFGQNFEGVRSLH